MSSPGSVKEIFADALEVAPQEREAFVARACGADQSLMVEVRALLDRHAGGRQFMAAATLGRLPVAIDLTAEQPGQMVGRYRLLQQIGEGGFGVVFMAEQREPVVRKVALKIIKLGMDTRSVIARFEAERQALAMMDHPNIAKVLDAGATEAGRPYFVMELVAGEPITQYCDRERLAIPQRLDLFVQVCRAVQHAHQKGIIHRDIKPGNVLVSTQDGRPHAKVIDFGIAKATSARLTERTMFTEHRALIGTPEYMSPEQADGMLDIDTRTDIYALGVLLYELLTGQTPFDKRKLREAAYGEIQRIIREEEPARPSTRLTRSADTLPGVAANRHVEPKRLGALVRGDLDWIVMKALEKDRARRYETANAFSADIERHLTGAPVEAAPPSASYRVRKFVRRHRVGVLSAGAVAAALLLGIAGTTAGMVWALREGTRAENQATLARTNETTAKAEAKRADDAAALAETRREAAEYEGYIANIEAAYGALRMNEITRLRARLDACPPKRRNWEWRYLDAAGDESAMTLQHPATSRNLMDAAYSPDGARIVTAGGDGTARVWDAVNGALLAELPRHSRALTSCAFSPDSQRILTSDYAGLLRLWHSGTYRLIAELAGHSKRVSHTAFTRDGTRIISASDDGTTRIWDGLTGSPIAVLQGHGGPVHSAALDADGRRFVTASDDHTARIWDAASGTQLALLEGHEEIVRDAGFSPDGATVVTASDDGTARVWDAATGRQVARLQHDASVYLAMYSSDGSRILTTPGSTPRVWDARTWQELFPLTGHTNNVWGAQFSDDGERILTRSADNTVRVWDGHTGLPQWTMRGHWETPWAAEFSPDGSRILTAGEVTARIWVAHRTSDDQVVSPLLRDSEFACFSPDGSRVLEIGRGRARLIDPESGTATDLFGRSDFAYSAGAFSPDGRLVARSFEGNTVEVWDIRAARTALTLRGHTATVVDIHFSRATDRIVTASEDNTARIWDARTGEVLHVLRGHDKRVASARFDPAGSRIVTASDDRSVRIWDAAAGTELRQLMGHRNRVLFATFNPDGSRVLSTSVEYTARVWDAATGAEQHVLRGHEHVVFGGSFSPDGSRIVTACFDGAARIWDARTGRQVLSVRVGPGGIHTAQFSPDGTRLLLFTIEGEARILDSVPFRERFARAHPPDPDHRAGADPRSAPRESTQLSPPSAAAAPRTDQR